MTCGRRLALLLAAVHASAVFAPASAHAAALDGAAPSAFVSHQLFLAIGLADPLTLGLAAIAVAVGAAAWLARRRAAVPPADRDGGRPVFEDDLAVRFEDELAAVPTDVMEARNYGRLASHDDSPQGAPSEEGIRTMRFGGRRDDDSRQREIPASRSAVEVAPQPVTPSRRLQRVAEHFRTQSELLSQMRNEFEGEMEPLHQLLVQQASTMQHLLVNLEERLRPLNEYADGEEANLDALEQRMNASGADHVARSFSDYLADQRARISATRGQIDQQRLPFLQYGEEQRDTIEVALSRFDNDMEALEQNLAEQRKVMMRMLESMRSDAFTAVKDFLLSRQEALSALAGSGSTDPTEIGRSVQQLRRSLEPLASDSPQVKAVLERVDQADKHLLSAAPPAPRPRVVASSDAPEVGDDEEAMA